MELLSFLVELSGRLSPEKQEESAMRSGWRIGFALALAVSLGGAAGGAPAGAGESEGEGFDRAARAEEVRQAELAFAASVMENRPERFAAMLADDAVFVGGGGVTRGREAIVEAWRGYFGENRPWFEWHPEVVELSADGSLGLTRGPWTIRTKDEKGAPVELEGLFNSVWRRQADGSWRVLFDAGCSPCPACGG
jgi:ketosteroid isomerase-like protein